ncbi:MAG TPA: FlgD immunoglobulin-like domain containing protein [bacterium]|nr:FlgD immunoglobulin-like domain containing protein [bacterium]
MVILLLVLNLAPGFGPASTPVANTVVNDFNPQAMRGRPKGRFATKDGTPETAWTRPVSTVYTCGVTPVQDTLMWVSAGQSELKIYIYNIKDPSRPLIDSFPQTGGPSGWGIRDMAWKASTNEVFAGFDNQKFHVYDATTKVPKHTYTVSGYSGTARGFGYDPAQDSCWTCDFDSSSMTKFSITGANGHAVRGAGEMMSSYGIAWSRLQNCFWVTQAGTAGSSPIYKMDPSYAWVDSFNPAGWDLGGGCEMWEDTMLLAVDQVTSGQDAIWCFKFNIPAHDVGVAAIVAPPGGVNPGAVTPKASVRNYGRNAESGIPVTCWIDSGAIRVYTASTSVPGPLEPGEDDTVSFSPEWNAGPAGARYGVTMFTALGGDENAHDDTVVGTTLVSGAVFADTIHVHGVGSTTPTIDGNIATGEWTASTMYDISDVAGRGGSPQPEGSCIAYFLYDSSFVYLAVDCPYRTTRVNGDQFGLYVDEDRSGTWPADSSEGDHWVDVDTGAVLYEALLDTTGRDTGSLVVVPGSSSASSLASGHLQFEAEIPIGMSKWQLNIGQGDTAGCFQYAAVDSGRTYVGWWPQTLTGSRWPNPRYYGLMVFDSLTAGVGSRASGPSCVLYRARPSLVRDHASISYYVSRQAEAELAVYDAAGSLVKTLVKGKVAPCELTVTWDRTDNSGRRVADGTYFYRLTAGGESVSSKAIVLR